MQHIMLDIETLGTRPGDAVFWIGAVKFDQDQILDRFVQAIDLASALGYRMKADGGTLAWWFDAQRDAARAQYMAAPKVHLLDALWGFAEWAGKIDGACWGNGALMDNNLMQALFRTVGIDWPFGYKQDACYRTIKNLKPEITLERVGTYHNPVDDAESQARHLQTIMAALGLTL